MSDVQESELDIFVSLDIRVDDGEARNYIGNKTGRKPKVPK